MLKEKEGLLMNILLLSGDSGKRLWPLSNGMRSRQFLQILKSPSGDYESVAQRVYRQIMKADKSAKIAVASSKLQVSAIRNQLDEGVEICVEPKRQNTFPAVALSVVWMVEKRKMAEEEVVIVCPMDTYAEDDYFLALKELSKMVLTDEADLALIGIMPAYPSEKYGYLLPDSGEKISNVIFYNEKPSESVANELIGRGALWNGGVFAFRVRYFMNVLRKVISFSDYDDLYQKYEQIPECSFEDVFLKEAGNKKSVRFGGMWKDLGTWNTLTDAMEESVVGKAKLDDVCRNVHVINELNIPILCLGIEDAVISAAPDGILVSDKQRSSYMEPLIDQLDQQIMFADKSWGSFQVLDIEHESMTIKVILKQGHRMNYHSHERRDEVWTVLSGRGRTVVDGMEQPVIAGDVITMQAGCRHTVIADTELHIMEVQLGREIDVHDKKKYFFED